MTDKADNDALAEGGPACSTPTPSLEIVGQAQPLRTPQPERSYPNTVGRMRLGENCSDGERLCGWDHTVPAGHPLYWPQRLSQYDDGDPCCLEHAIEQYISEAGYTNPVPQPDETEALRAEDNVVVERVDRELFVGLLLGHTSDDGTGILRGDYDAHIKMQAIARHRLAAQAHEPSANEVEVRKVETVTGDFMQDEGEPFWRIEIGGYCADFDHEQAARNFAAAIAAMRPESGDHDLATVAYMALEEAARAAEQKAQDFLSPEYATGQPLSSFSERFACGQIAEAIRNLARFPTAPEAGKSES